MRGRGGYHRSLQGPRLGGLFVTGVNGLSRYIILTPSFETEFGYSKSPINNDGQLEGTDYVSRITDGGMTITD